MQGSSLASLGRPLWRLLEANKIDAEFLFKRNGLDPLLINQSRTRYPFNLMSRAWSEAAAITENAHIGLEAGKHYTPLDLNALGVTFLSSSTLTGALQRLERYESVLNSSIQLSVIEQGDRIEVQFDPAAVDTEAAPVMEDVRMSVTVDLCRRGYSGELDPIEVAFTYPEPEDLGNYFGIFRCPLVFSAKAERIAFKAADAQRPFTDANRELALVNDQVLDSMIRDLATTDLVSSVKRAIIHDLPSGAPSEADVAKQLFVSSRTLQRRLADEGTNFRSLLLEVRRELAEKYILDKSMPLAEISYMLGFADISSFSRAFKKWTGEPPAVFRSKSA